MNNLLLDQTNFYWTLPHVRQTLGMTDDVTFLYTVYIKSQMYQHVINLMKYNNDEGLVAETLELKQGLCYNFIQQKLTPRREKFNNLKQKCVPLKTSESQ